MTKDTSEGEGDSDVRGVEEVNNTEFELYTLVVEVQ